MPEPRTRRRPIVRAALVAAAVAAAVPTIASSSSPAQSPLPTDPDESRCPPIGSPPRSDIPTYCENYQPENYKQIDELENLVKPLRPKLEQTFGNRYGGELSHDYHGDSFTITFGLVSLNDQDRALFSRVTNHDPHFELTEVKYSVAQLEAFKQTAFAILGANHKTMMYAVGFERADKNAIVVLVDQMDPMQASPSDDYGLAGTGMSK